jgi:CheY-like chemotaxis protein/predicted regulator of Ras-like GTPase activity (Roadblock/LC7/MglB family)
MASKILVVDGNEAFATMLRDMLERDGGYDVVVAPSGSDAMACVERQEFDLVIVDMELDPQDMDSGQLVQKARSEQPDIRLMLIPLMGGGLPPETHEWDIQGTLTKPFFADDLLPNIEEALSKQVETHSASRPTIDQPEPKDDVEQIASDIRAVLLDLGREIRADAVLLLAGSDGAEGVVAHTTALDVQELEALSSLVTETVQAAQAVARFLGQPDVPFEHNMFESGAQRLYAMTLPGDLVLVVVTPISTNLGTVRHNLRRATRELAALALT